MEEEVMHARLEEEGLHDPVAAGVIYAVEQHNRHCCRELLELNHDRVAHFRRRAVELGRKDVAIVVLDVDDSYGGPLAEVYMPGEDWQQYRDRGEVPIARGLVERTGLQHALGFFDEGAASKLELHTDGVPVVVVTCGVAEVF
jgi:hypothetical protein